MFLETEDANILKSLKNNVGSLLIKCEKAILPFLTFKSIAPPNYLIKSQIALIGF